MVERFQAWERNQAGADPPAWARRGVLFGLGSSIPAKNAPEEYRAFAASYPEHRTYNDKDLAFVPTVFDRLDRELVNRLVYRGWWLTGATLARWQPGFGSLRPDVRPPIVSS